MKTLVFSDTHLSRRFEPKKFSFLHRIIQNADQVIINGDFWDGYTTTFDRFMNSKWNQLFPLLKSKKTIYILGNHDKKKFIDDRVYQFADHCVSQYKLVSKKMDYIFEHGHRLVGNQDEHIESKWLLFILTHIVGLVEKVSTRLFGQNILFFIGKKQNKTIKTKLKTEYKSAFFVCGHTHIKEYDKKNRYINHGFIRHGYAQYLILDDGQISLKEEQY